MSSLRLALALAVVAVTYAGNCTAGNAPLVRRIGAATAGCDVVVYTTVVYGEGVRLPHPRTRLGPGAYDSADKGVCYLIVAGALSAAALRDEHCGDTAPWVIVGAADGGRRASRTVKLNPLAFFGPRARYLVFVDWKLRLLRAPRRLVADALGGGGGGGYGFAAFRHPCTCAYTSPRVSPCNKRRPDEPWWRTEARLVRAKTEDPAALRAQIERYERSGSPLSQYVDGSLLLWDARHPVAAALSCAWYTEYARDDSSDRDQLAFARAITAVATSPSPKADGVFLIAEGRRPDCGALCHTYEKGDTTEGAGARVLPRDAAPSAKCPPTPAPSPMGPTAVPTRRPPR